MILSVVHGQILSLHRMMLQRSVTLLLLALMLIVFLVSILLTFSCLLSVSGCPLLMIPLFLFSGLSTLLFISVLELSMSKTSNERKVFSRFSLPSSPSVEFKDASLTRQEFAAESDINNIMRKYAAGLPPAPAGARPPMFGDFSNLPDYQTALDTVIQAQEAFDALPARVRERFGNDPQKVLDFLADDSNRQEAIYLGLIEGEKVDDVDVPVSVPDKKEGAD